MVDIRDNLGGSLLPLFILTEYLFGQQTARAFSKCQKYTMKTNDVFKRLYYDQYIIPLMTDATLSERERNLFKKMGKQLLKSKQPQSIDGPMSSKCNQRSLKGMI